MVEKLTEPEIRDTLYAILKEGEAGRRNNTNNPYDGNSLYHMLFSYGWVREDLRIGYMKANPAYEKQQAAFGQGLQ